MGELRISVSLLFYVSFVFIFYNIFYVFHSFVIYNFLLEKYNLSPSLAPSRTVLEILPVSILYQNPSMTYSMISQVANGHHHIRKQGFPVKMGEVQEAQGSSDLVREISA